MAPRRRGDRSRRLQAFQNDPKLLVIRPTPPSAGLNDLKPINLSTVLMAVHKHCYTSLSLTNKVAAPGGLQRKVLSGKAHRAGRSATASPVHRPRAGVAAADFSGYWPGARL